MTFGSGARFLVQPLLLVQSPAAREFSMNKPGLRHYLFPLLVFISKLVLAFFAIAIGTIPFSILLPPPYASLGLIIVAPLALWFVFHSREKKAA